jgi:hypothetical protein
MDSCYSASGTRSSGDSPNILRFVQPRYDLKLQENLDQEILSSFPSNGSLQSHVLLSACSSSGSAWESKGRGVFTVALLELLKDCRMDKLRYCDIIMRLEIPSQCVYNLSLKYGTDLCIFRFPQSPHCEGLNLKRYIFTTTSLSVEYFIPAYTRISNNGPFAFILNGGAAHGLRVGDEFAIYPDMDCPQPNGSLVVDELGPFYSIMRTADPGFPMGSNAVATRSRQGQPRPVHIYCLSEDISKILSPSQDISRLIITHTPEGCDIIISMEDHQAIVRASNMGNTQGFPIEPTASELARILKASWQFFSELYHTADFPDITQCIQVHIFELTMSPFRFPDAVPYARDFFTLRQGSYYGIELINNSRYNLYPIVQYFDPSNEFKFGTLGLSLKRQTEILFSRRHIVSSTL